MRICFSGFEEPIELRASVVSVLEINNRVLFARVCESLRSGEGSYAIEPYSLWIGEEELKPTGCFLYVGDPLNLPWDDRLLAGALASRMEALAAEDEVVRRGLEEAFAALSEKVISLALQLDSDYSFGVDWELKRYLKSFGFGLDVASDEPLIDKLIKFLHLAKDTGLKKPLIFVNLKLFLSESELELLYEQAIFSGLSILLVENVFDSKIWENERKYTIDQDFLEVWPRNQSD